jgi:hypothetical protein
MAMAVCCVRCAVLLLEVFVVCWVVAVAVRAARCGRPCPGLLPASARCCCFLRWDYLPICRLDTGCMAAAATGAL